MFNILKVDTNKIELNEAYDIALELRKVLGKDDAVLVLPYGIDILLDVPIEEIISIRDTLNSVIESRSQQNDL